MSALIELLDVSKAFAGGKVALESLSLTVDAEQPRFIAVVGESGSGKTTLARLMLGMIAPTRGEVRY
jgi:ABC-type bacteriocin/lantibiotic exporter with double-glycine peptidase domain